MAAKTPTTLEQFETLIGHIHLMKSHCARQGVAVTGSAATAIAEAENWRRRAAALAAGGGEGEDEAAAEEAHSVFVAGALPAAWAAHARLCELIAPATPESIEWNLGTGEGKITNREWFVGWMGIVTVLAMVIIVVLLSRAPTADENQNADVAARVIQLLKARPAGSSTTISAEALQALRTEVVKATEAIGAASSGGGAGESLLAETRVDLKRLETALTPAPLPPPAPTPGSTPTTPSNPPSAVPAPPAVDPAAVDAALTSLRGHEAAWRALLPRRNGSDLILLISAGILGAAFFNLCAGYQFISSWAFDPVYVQKYYLRLVVGAVSGLILAQFGGEVIDYFNGGRQSTGVRLSRTFIALIGGYSVDVVNLMLARVVESFATLFKGTSADVVAAKEKEMAANLAKQTAELRADVISKLAVVRGQAAITPGDLDKLIQSLKA